VGAPTLTDTSLTVESGDIFKLAGTASAADKYTYWEYDFTDIATSFSSKWLVRYKTSVASVGLGAKVEVVYKTPAGTEVLFGTTPLFSNEWTTIAGTIVNAGGATLIDKIRFYAVSDAACSGAVVWYDFALLHEATFIFPFFKNVRLETPRKDVEIDIPGRDGGILQKLGLKSPIIILSGSMQHGEDTWGGSDYLYGEYLLRVIRDSDPWQWFTSDVINCKVAPADEPFFIEQTSDSDGAQRVWGLRFKQCSLSDLGDATWDGRQWYGK